MNVKRSEIVLKPNNHRVLFRPFQPNDPQRALKIVARVMELREEEAEELTEQVLTEFHGQHRQLRRFFLQRFDAVSQYLLTDHPPSDSRKLLIGAYFTQEYALESAALFNPSMVWHPDQSGLPDGARRFIVSLRATGEGHISSICFRQGIVDAGGGITVQDPTGSVTLPEVVPNMQYEKLLFRRKLAELGIGDGFVESVMNGLGDSFTLDELQARIRIVLRQARGNHQNWDSAAPNVLALAKANKEIQYDPETDLSERIIFPYSPNETNGIEDARFVSFTEDDGSLRFYATYTAFDGRVTFPQLVETQDFLRFRISTLNGPEIRDKGMALFPRKINGAYAMLSRQDGENLYLMYSDALHFWYQKRPLLRPTFSWEFVQVGNCGSPIETEAGWLVLSHGVGPMRKYSIGAFMLDLEDPSRVIGRLPRPLLTPNENERRGYVPNVVYSCGALVHNGRLILPYAMSDYATTFATIALDEVLQAMEPV
jgi:predicted GH43/DUF377 family glycosyl hydrolase